MSNSEASKVTHSLSCKTLKHLPEKIDAFRSVAQSCPVLWDPMNCSTPGLPVHHQTLKFTQTHVHWVGDAIQPSHPLSSTSPALNLSQHQVFSNESALCIRGPKDWSFSFNISPSNEHPGLLSFRMDWLDLLEVKGLSRVFSNTTVQKHQLFGAQLSSSYSNFLLLKLCRSKVGI